MPTATVDRTGRALAPEVLQQRDRLRDAMGMLEEALASPSAVRLAAWGFGVGTATDALQAALARHSAVTEGPGGLLAEIAVAAPHLTHAVAAVRREHDTIDALLERLAVATATLPEGGDLPVRAVGEAVDGVRTVGRDLLAVLVHHRQRGIELTYQAFCSDLGSGD